MLGNPEVDQRQASLFQRSPVLRCQKPHSCQFVSLSEARQDWLRPALRFVWRMVSASLFRAPMRTHFRLWSNQRVAFPSRPRLTSIMIVESCGMRHAEVSSTGNSTFVAAKIIRFEVTRAVASRVCGRGRSESSFRALTTAVQPQFRHAEFGGPQLPPKGSYGERNAEGNSVDAGSSKEQSVAEAARKETGLHRWRSPRC